MENLDKKKHDLIERRVFSICIKTTVKEISNYNQINLSNIFLATFKNFPVKKCQNPPCKLSDEFAQQSLWILILTHVSARSMFMHISFLFTISISFSIFLPTTKKNWRKFSMAIHAQIFPHAHPYFGKSGLRGLNLNYLFSYTFLWFCTHTEERERGGIFAVNIHIYSSVQWI